MHHLYSAPTVKGNLTDVEMLTEAFNEFFNVAVMHNISFGGLYEALTFPNIIRNEVSLHTQVDGFLRYQEIRDNGVFVVLI